MGEGLTGDLLLAAGVIAVLTLFVCGRYLPLPTAVFVSGVKALIPLIYFAYFYDGTWHFLDDQTYFLQGREMLARGYSPLTALSDPEAVTHLMVLVNGPHILYVWWNILAQFLFGPHYFSAVFLNVFLTVLCGAVFYKVILRLEFPASYARAFLVFFLLQWDILAWSSLINLKDILIMLLTALALLSFMRFVLERSPLPLLYLTLTLVSLFFIRYYVIGILAGTVLVWWLLKKDFARQLLLAPLLLLALYLFLPPAWMTQASSHGLGKEIFFQFIRFIGTPLPWSVAEATSFLTVLAVIHWVFLAPMILAGIKLWQEYPMGRLLLLYVLIGACFYALFSELVGPRQRVQFVPVLAWAQFHFLWMLSQRKLLTLLSTRRLKLEYRATALPT